MTAPLQVIALSFSRDAGAEDRILAEVDRLRGRGVLRLLDMLFVAKARTAPSSSWPSVMTRTSARSWRRSFPLRTAVRPGRRQLTARPLTRPMRGLWPILSSRGPLWPSCSWSTTGPPRFLTQLPRLAAR